MQDSKNPFVYDTANNLDASTILDVYIKDHNYHRFIESKRNVVIEGERGSGKTISLLYSSQKVKSLLRKRLGEQEDYTAVGVYVPCNNPLMHKREHELLSDPRSSILSEHYLVLVLIHYLVVTLELIDDLDKDALHVVRDDIRYILGWDLRTDVGVLMSIRQYLSRLQRIVQEQANDFSKDIFYKQSLSFSSSVLPLVEIFKSIPELNGTHFLFLIDDAHDLNTHQRRVLNSWISFREHPSFSFKVAVAKVIENDYVTVNGGTILEGHDFTAINMERPFQDEQSEFGKLAAEIIEKRLERVGIFVSAQEFFPENEDVRNELEAAKDKVREDYLSRNPGATSKQIGDYVYKYGRVEMFRSRHSKANHVQYSGFDALTHVSTGVVRNLLDPCYWMFEKMQSGLKPGELPTSITSIPAKVQDEVLVERSQVLWLRLQNDLSRSVLGCTKDQASKVYNLMDNLVLHFRDRLINHQSEPRAISFTISGQTEEAMAELRPLIDIARKFQILYTRRGPAKDDGLRETYYVPNRMLLLERGLDPVGQHARVSLKASDLIDASNGKPFSSVVKESDGQEKLLYA